MDVKRLRELLSERLYLELQLFRDAKLVQDKEDIFRSSYEIEVYVNLYEILTAYTDSLQKDVIRRLLNLKTGIMESLYRGWLTREDSFYDELRSYACRELEAVSGSARDGEEDADG